MSAARAPRRIGVICDFREEGWPSMELVGEMVVRSLREELNDDGAVAALCPRMHRRAGRIPGAGSAGWRVDRVVNRFVDYPLWLAARRRQHDIFHIVDHSYGQLAHVLPPRRTIVTCHDIDTFRSLRRPASTVTARAFRAMTSVILSGIRRAAAVICVSDATRGDLLAHGLVEADRLHVVHNGVHPAFSPEADATADEEVQRLLGPRRGPELLHVGSVITRKRIDVLLRTVALVRRHAPGLRLLKAGDPFTAEQATLIRTLKLEDCVTALGPVERAVLAGLYRRADALLVPSDFEGFGLPVVESLASGTVVFASDIAALREVGGTAAIFCPPGDPEAWARQILAHLGSITAEDAATRRAGYVAHASTFSWRQNARKTLALYESVLAS